MNLWSLLGMMFVLLAFIGALLPVMPTVPFVLVAAACFAKSSPKMHSWLQQHPKFGHIVCDWEEKRCISRGMKIWGISMMTLGGGISVWLVVPRGWPSWTVLGCFIAADMVVLLWKECPSEPGSTRRLMAEGLRKLFFFRGRNGKNSTGKECE